MTYQHGHEHAHAHPMRADLLSVEEALERILGLVDYPHDLCYA